MIFNKFKKQSLKNNLNLIINYDINSKKTIGGIKLSSPSPFKNDLKKFNILYLIFPAIFIVLANKDLSTIFSIIIGFCGAFTIINIISSFKVGKLRTMEFALSTPLTKDQITDIITLPLTQLNMKVENLSYYIRITHNKFQYDIIISKGRNTFRVWPQKSFLSRLFARTSIKLYKNAILSIPIICYTIQSELNKHKSKI